MKSRILIILCVVSVLLVGCKSNNDQITSFIPTQAVTPSPAPEEENTEEVAPAEEPSTEPTTMYVKLNDYGAKLNIRDNPSKDGALVGTLVHSEKIEVISIENGWASFMEDDKVYYVNSEFLVTEEPEPIPMPTVTPTPVVTPTTAPTPTIAATPTPTNKPTPTVAPTPTKRPSVTAIPRPTKTPTPEPTKPAPTKKPAKEPTPTVTPAPTQAPTQETNPVD
ncbi:MAG: hypothetical protein K0S47_2507 [Herbinix sp.]|jgi:hypothetical protein|nr:hypothetical protein [Herbinix sp.]